MKNQNRLTRYTGVLLLLSFIVPTMNWIFIYSGFIVESSPVKTAEKIAGNDFLFRIGIMHELLTAFIITGLGAALYLLLKKVNKGMALWRFFLRFTEAIITLVIALGHYITLLFLKSNVSDSVQVKHMAGNLLIMHIPLTAVAGILLSLSMMIFTVLMFKTRLIPKILAGFGFLAFLLIFLYDSLTILFPGYAGIQLVQISFTAPVCLFIMAAGFWLILKGAHIQKKVDIP